MTFTDLEKYVYSKTTTSTPFTPSSNKAVGQEPMATTVLKGLNGLFSHSHEGTEEQQWRKVRYGRFSFLLP